MTVLQSVLSFIGASMASGITWDILKYSGERLIHKFSKEFVQNGCLDNEEQGYEMIENIAKTPALSKKNAYKDVETIYENIAENIQEDFVELFKQWIEKNKDELEAITKNTSQRACVKIKTQMSFGSSTIVNAGIINKG